MSPSRRLASIDIGTNSTRLLVADCDGRRTVTLDRRMVITRLGEGVDSARRLAPAAVQRTAVVLEGYRAAMDALAPIAVSAASTSVLRDAANAGKFLDEAERIIGARPQVLPGEEEARMSFVGALSDLPEERCVDGKVLVFDIGGGSTEIIVGDPDASELHATSVDVGCVRMSERFLTADPPSPVAVGRMESHIISVLKPAMDRMLAGVQRCLAVGLAGTVTTLSGIRQGLTEYDTERIHHSSLARADVEEMYRKLATVTVAERKQLMGLEPGRADIIVGGAAVLRAIMDLAGLDEILVSEKDILDGLVLDLYAATD